MTKQKEDMRGIYGFVDRNHKTIHIAIICIMVSLICWCTLMSMDYDIMRDTSSAANTMIDMILMTFLVLLFGFSASSKYAGNRQNIIFSLLICVDFLMLFCSTLGYITYGLPEQAEFERITGSLGYMLCYVSFAVLWKYQKFFYKNTIAVKVGTGIIYSSVLVYSALSIANIFSPVLFIIDQNGVYDESYIDYISTIIGVLLVVTMYVNVLISDCEPKKKIALASYEIAPSIMIIISIIMGAIQSNIYLPAVIDASLLFPLYIIFYSIYVEQKNEIERSEVEQMRMETSVMLSQIQPHFLYNCLSSIAVLCDDEPTLAGKATTTFADYLRENMSYIGSKMPIPFSEEMSHVERYVWLEKIRFGDRVSVVYDLACTDFRVPALTIQPLVENAIKHGICKGGEKGTVTITSAEERKSYIITIADDGVGFDPSESLNDGREHIGIESVRKRLQSMVGGSMTVETAPGKGTTVTITIPKNGGVK